MKSNGKGVEATQSELTPGLRRFLLVTSAFTGAAVMIVEILGAKILAPYLGTSHFVWTAQIAVTLMALALGYSIGGRMADANPHPRRLYLGLLGAAVYLCLTLVAYEKLAYVCILMPLALAALVVSFLLFLIPLTLMAMVVPFLSRVLTSQVASVGTSVGRLSALSTAGSVAGTLLIGYCLIPYLANSTTLFLTAGSIFVLVALYFVIWDRRKVGVVAGVGALGIGLGVVGVRNDALFNADFLKELYRGNSNFGVLQVAEDGSGRRYFLNDWLTQNTYHPATQKSESLFTYLLHGLAMGYTEKVDRVLCIGMGIGIVPMEFARAGKQVDVVEINPAVVPVAGKYFNFDASLVRLHFADGRQYLNGCSNRFDAVVLDAFVGDSAPSHLITKEALQSIRRVMAPGGVLVMNTIADVTPGKDLVACAVYRTLEAVFQNVRMHASGNGNVFYVAFDGAADRKLVRPDFRQVPEVVRDSVRNAFDGILSPAAGRGFVLTDDYNPMDALDAPWREEIRRRFALAYGRARN